MKSDKKQLRPQKTLRIDADLDEALDAAAAERQISVNLLINYAIRDYLARLVPVAEVLVTMDRSSDEVVCSGRWNYHVYTIGSDCCTMCGAKKDFS